MHQDDFIVRMKALKYKADPDGVCFGIAHMGMQAILADDLETFDERIKLISKISENEFNETLDAAKNAWTNTIESIKKSPGFPKRYSELNESEKLEIENDIAYKKIKTTIINEGTLEAKEREKTITERSDQALYNIYVQRKINKAWNDLSQEKRLMLDIPAFMEGVELYYQGYQYPDFLEKKTAVTTQQKIPDIVSKLIVPTKISENGGVSKVDQFTGLYSANELALYFNNLYQLFATYDGPIALVLSSGNHSICIGYDKRKQKPWSLIDANKLPTQYFSNLSEIPSIVMEAFMTEKHAAFLTQIYVNQTSETKITNSVKGLKNQKDWLDLHAITKEKQQAVDSFGFSWLFIAAQSGDLKKVRALLKPVVDSKNHTLIHPGIDPNIRTNNVDRMTPLFIAAQEGHINIVKKLLKAGAKPNLVRTDGVSPLLIASQKGHLDVVKRLLKAGADLKLLRTDNGISPLYMAAQEGHLDVVKKLLRAGADPNLARTDNGISPLYIAAQEGHVNVLKRLLKAGANPNIRTNNGASPLLIAALKGRLDIVKILLKAGADLSLVRTDNGISPLLVAALKGHLDIVKTLLKAGADPNSVDTDGTSALYMAAQYGHLDVVKRLLKTSANPNLVDRDGTSPLFIAAQNGHLEVVKALIKNTIDISLPSTWDLESLQTLANKHKVTNRLELFFQENKVNKKKNIRLIPEQIAQIMGHTEVQNLLWLNREMTNETETSLRFAVYKIFYDKCMSAPKGDVGVNLLITQFKLFEGLTTKLYGVIKTYSSGSTVQPNNNQHDESMEKLNEVINASYIDLLKDNDIAEVINNLEMKSKEFILVRQNDYIYDKSSQLFTSNRKPANNLDAKDHPSSLKKP